MNILALSIWSENPTLYAAAILIVFAAAFGLFAAITDYRPSVAATRRAINPYLQREFDIAAALGWQPERWIILRVSVVVVGIGVGVFFGIPLLVLVLGGGGFAGVRWAVSGRAASKQLQMQRAFLGRLRDLRDRMAVSNQSLDTALQELGRNPGRGLGYVLSPLARGGSTVGNLVEVGERSRSPVVEYACGVLIWARGRSLDSLIDAIDNVLLPVGTAQLGVEEESMIVLVQQRVVTYVMVGLLSVLFFAFMQNVTFRAYYQSFGGQITLFVVLIFFAICVWVLGKIMQVTTWTRWSLKRLAREQELFNA